MKWRSWRLWRRLSQLTVLLAFILIPVLNKVDITILRGNLLGFSLAGLPLGDPLAALQVFVATGSGPVAMFLGAGIVLGIALVLGPVFCGWLCPYGLLSELVQGKKSLAQSPAGQTSPSSAWLPFYAKALFAGIGLVAVALVVPFPLLNQFSLPGWYTRLWQHGVLYRTILWGGLAFLVGMLIVERLFHTRLWCRYCCPQSVLLSLAGLIVPRRLRLYFEPKRCTCPATDRPCQRACSLRLAPRKSRELAQRLQCINCGDCVDACKKKGCALSLRLL